MVCLVPQFMCPSDASTHFRATTAIVTSHFQPHLHYFTPPFRLTFSKRSSSCQHIHCRSSTTLLSTSIGSETATLVDLDKLRLTPFEANSDLSVGNIRWKYSNDVDRPTKDEFENISSMKLLTNEEVEIAAASAEAVTLAKAAAKVAKDAALFLNNPDSTRTGINIPNISEDEAFEFNQDVPTGKVKELFRVDTTLRKEDSWQYDVAGGDVEPTFDELELLEENLSKCITVRSNRQSERKAKRSRAAEKAGASVVSVKSGSNVHKKRNSVQDVVYSDPLRYLRATTSSHRLLSAADELELSEGIQDLLKLEEFREKLAERLGKQPTFGQWASAAGVDQKTLRKRLNYGTACKDKMIKSNIRLVISIAKNYQGAGMNLQDLVQEGCRGLVRGAEKFDGSKGFKFSTYAHWWIRQTLRRSLSDQSRTIRLPFYMVEATYKVREARKQLYTENRRQPNDEELAEAAGISMKRLASVLLTPKSPRSLDQKIGINQNLKPSEVMSNPDEETSEELLVKQFMREDLQKVLDSLSPREKLVVQWRFGMEDGRIKTLQEIGERMGISRERVRQIEASAFRKLKNKKRTKHLRQYLYS